MTLQTPQICALSGAGGLPPDDEFLLTTRQVRIRCGNVTSMSIWRWERDGKVGFPPPAMRINGRKYWMAGAIRAWVAARAALEGADASPSTPQGGPYLDSDAPLARPAASVPSAGDAMPGVIRHA